MKYLIEDNVGHDQCPIAYLKGQLRLTDLKYENCRIDDSLATKVAMHELARILTENGCERLTIHDDSITLDVSGNTISFAPIEVLSRFEDVFNDLRCQIEDEGEMKCSNTMKPDTVEVDVPLGTIEYTREELSKEISDLTFLRDAFLVLLNEDCVNGSDIMYNRNDVIVLAKLMYMDSSYSKEFIEECFATAK